MRRFFYFISFFMAGLYFLSAQQLSPAVNTADGGSGQTTTND